MAYKFGSNNSMSSVAATLRTCIKNSFSKYDKVPWPPTAEYLKNIEGIIPEELERFLKIIISGKDTESVRVNRLALSIGQDVCRAATNGHWPLPKHSNETQICIVHHIGNSNQNFTLLKNLPDPLQRLSYIQEIGALRQSQPVDSNERLDAQCKCIPEKLSDLHGYHRSCYQRFTKNKDRLKSNSEQEPSTSSTLKTRRTSSDKILFAKDCIFCNKEGRIWRKK